MVLAISILIVFIAMIAGAVTKAAHGADQRNEIPIQDGYRVKTITINGHSFLQLSDKYNTYIVHDPDCPKCNPQQVEIENKE